MKIPNEELVKRIIKQKMKESGTVNSQEELGSLVEKEFNKIDDSFKISSRRARRIALKMPEIRVTVKTRESKGEKPDRCPACGEDLKPLHAKNLKGKMTEVGFRCKNCNYHGDVEAFTPMRYKFKYIKD